MLNNVVVIPSRLACTDLTATPPDFSRSRAGQRTLYLCSCTRGIPRAVRVRIVRERLRLDRYLSAVVDCGSQSADDICKNEEKLCEMSCHWKLRVLKAEMVTSNQLHS